MSRTFARQHLRTRPWMEVLEDRFMPATRIWDGGAISNNWSNASNWQGNVAPVAGDDLIFPSTASDKTADNNFSDGTLFNSITLGGGYTLRGNQIRLGVGGILSLGSSNIINNDISLTGGTAVPRNIQVNSGATLFIDGEISGSHPLHKLGTGDLSFRANNSYTNVTDIKAGRLFIEKDDSLGSTSAGAATLIRSGAKLFVNDHAIGTIRSGENIVMDDGSSIQAVNDVELTGFITTQGSATLSHAGGELEKLLMSGQIIGPGNIVIANNTGQVKFAGTAANTYEGVTTVFGRLRLEKLSGNAIPGSSVIHSNGTVRLDGPHQIADAATVTVIDDGFLLTNEKDDVFHKLRLQGGAISGSKLRLTEWSPLFYIDLLGRLLNRLPYVSNFVPERESKITLNEFEATSLVSSQSAQVLDVSITLTSADGLIRVNNGPAETDLMLYGTIFSAGSAEPGDSRLTLEGTGKTILQDYPTDQYFINSGELQFAQFKRDLISPSFIGADVTVKTGAKFTGDVTLGNLLVETGGRVHPGPITRPNFYSAVLEQLVTGTLGVAGDLVMAPGSILEVQLNHAVSGIGHESLNVAGSVTIDGLIIEPTMGPSAVVGQNYRVINNQFADPINGFIAVPSGGLLISAPTGQRLSFNQAGGLSNNDLVLTLQNTPPMAPDLALNTTIINEGGTVTATGKLVDPDTKDKLKLYVNWGDGSRQQVLEPGRSTFRLSHQYRDNGNYVARFEWLDQLGTGNSRSFDIVVNQVVPVLEISQVKTSHSRALLALARAVHPSQEAFVVTIDYGDGSTARTHHVNHQAYLTLNHKYRSAGTYVLTITARDKDGDETVLQRTVRV